MNKKIRLFLAVLILLISVSLLLWGYTPNPREMLIQQIAPAEMRLP